jgi:hypothetical protein
MSWQAFLETIAPTDDDVMMVNLPARLSDILLMLKFVGSRGEAKRLFTQKGVRIAPAFKDMPVMGNNNWFWPTEDITVDELPRSGMILAVGRRKFKWVQTKSALPVTQDSQ